MDDYEKTFQIEYLLNNIQKFNKINYIKIEDVTKFISQNLNLRNNIDFVIKKNSLIFCNDKSDALINNICDTVRNHKNGFDEIASFLKKSEIRIIIKEETKNLKGKYKILYRSKERCNFINSEKMFESFELKKLSNLVLEDDIEETGNYKNALENAYVKSYIGKYYEAYKMYKQISKNALKDKEFVFYIISEFNRYYIGRIIVNNYWEINTTSKVVKKEIENIDLDKLMLKLPLNEIENEFIRTLISWKFANSNEILRIKQKIDKDEKTCYMFIDEESTGIYQAQTYIKNFLKFIRYNFLAVEKYIEVKRVFYNYIDIIMKSYKNPKIYLSETNGFLGEKAENVKIEKISLFDIRCIIEFIEIKELENILQRYNIKEIEINNEEIEQFIILIKNFIDFYKDNNKNFNSEKIEKILMLLSVIKLTNDQFQIVSNCIMEYIEKNKIDLSYYKYLNKYIYCQCEYFKNSENNILYNILLDILKDIEEDNDTIVVDKVNIIHNLTSYIKRESKVFKFKDKELFDRLFKKSDNNDICFVLIKLFKILDDNERRKVKRIIYSKLDVDKYCYHNCQIYYEILMDKIIRPKEEYENKYYDYIKLENESQKSKKIKIYPDHLETALKWTNNLILNNYIINKKRFEDFLGIMDDYDFLFDINKFPCEKFKIEWLDKYSDNLINTISKNKNLKKEIKYRIERMILENDYVDNKLLKRYVKYFT